MRVTVYDKNPGTRLTDHALAFWWMVGCWLQKVLGQVDEYYGAQDWADASQWLLSRPGMLTSVQYWGHGTQGTVWCAEKPVSWPDLLSLKPKLAPTTLLWFRICSSFGGRLGHEFSQTLADGLGCTIAGHTRIIGIVQGGLHTRKPNSLASWAESDGEFPETWYSDAGLEWGPHSILFLQTKIPDGW